MVYKTQHETNDYNAPRHRESERERERERQREREDRNGAVNC